MCPSTTRPACSRAALHLRQRRHSGAGHRLLQPPDGAGADPAFSNPIRFPWLHLAGERRTRARRGGAGRAGRARRGGGAGLGAQGGPGRRALAALRGPGRSLQARVAHSRRQRRGVLRGVTAPVESGGEAKHPGRFRVRSARRAAELKGLLQVGESQFRSSWTGRLSVALACLAAPRASPWLLPQKTAHKPLQPAPRPSSFLQTRYPVLTD